MDTQQDSATTNAGATRRWLWRQVGRFWRPKWWSGNALGLAREYYPERLLMHRIFHGRKRFLLPGWWWAKLITLTLPPNNSGTKTDE